MVILVGGEVTELGLFDRLRHWEQGSLPCGVGWGKVFLGGRGKFRCRNLSGCSPIDAMLGTKVDRNAVAAKQASLAVDGIKA